MVEEGGGGREGGRMERKIEQVEMFLRVVTHVANTLRFFSCCCCFVVGGGGGGDVVLSVLCLFFLFLGGSGGSGGGNTEI